MEVCDPRVGVSYVTVMVISLLVCQQIGRGMRGLEFQSASRHSKDLMKIRWSHNYVKDNVFAGDSQK
jgi:hypothetical protein